MPQVRLLKTWMALPPGRVVDVSRGEAELLVGSGTAESEDGTIPAPVHRADRLSTPETRAVKGPDRSPRKRR